MPIRHMNFVCNFLIYEGIKMKKIVLISLFLAGFLSGIGALMVSKFDVRIVSFFKKKKPRLEKVHRVAVLMPVLHPSLEQIKQGFIDTLKKSMENSCEIDVYNANGDRTLMRSQVEEIIAKNYDLIFPIATQPTQMAKEITTKKHTLIPIVFGAVNKPVKLGLVKSLSSSGNHLTGVTETIDHEKQFTLLLKLKPSVKNVLLLYNPSQGSGLESDKNLVKNILDKKGITLKTLEVFQTNEIFSKVSSQLQEIDALLVLKDNTVVPAMDALVKLCNRNNVTLVTSDLDSCDKGAAFSLGVRE